MKKGKAVMQDMERQRDEQDLFVKSSELASKEKREVFESVIVSRQNEVERALGELIAKTRYNDEIGKVTLQSNLLQVVVKMPAYWSDTAMVSCRFDVFRKGNIEFDINYGAGGYNSGWSPLDAARQKAEAILLVCDLVAKLEKMDWTAFVGYQNDVVKRQQRILAELKQK